jgi:hypothetical protein
MATVTVTFEGSADVSEVRIDNAPVLLGTGEASVSVGGGREHSLMWFVRGAPGSSYELKVTEPDEAKFSHSAKIDGSTKDAGLHWFQVNGGGQ